MKPVTTSVGVEKLLAKAGTIEVLDLGDRPNPGSAFRWLIRTKKLGGVRVARGVLRFRPDNVEERVNRSHRKADTYERPIPTQTADYRWRADRLETVKGGTR